MLSPSHNFPRLIPSISMTAVDCGQNKTLWRIGTLPQLGGDITALLAAGGGTARGRFVYDCGRIWGLWAWSGARAPPGAARQSSVLAPVSGPPEHPAGDISGPFRRPGGREARFLPPLTSLCCLSVLEVSIYVAQPSGSNFVNYPLLARETPVDFLELVRACGWLTARKKERVMTQVLGGEVSREHGAGCPVMSFANRLHGLPVQTAAEGASRHRRFTVTRRRGLCVPPTWKLCAAKGEKVILTDYIHGP